MDKEIINIQNKIENLDIDEKINIFLLPFYNIILNNDNNNDNNSDNLNNESVNINLSKFIFHDKNFKNFKF